MQLNLKAYRHFTWIAFSLALVGGCAPMGQEEKGPDQPKPATVKEVVVDSQKHLLKPLGGDLISLSLFIKGGVANYPRGKAGIEPLSLKTAILGSPRNKDERLWQKRLTASGIRFSTQTTKDYSVISVNAPEKHWEKAWKMFQGIVQRPALDSNSLEEARSELINQIKARNKKPHQFLSNKSMAYAFEKRDYAKPDKGSIKQLENLKRRDVLRYFKSMMSKRRLLAVASGPLDSAKMAEQLNQLWVKLNDKPYQETGDSSLMIMESSVEYFDKAVETNYLRGLFMAPPSGTNELLAMKVGLRLVKDKLSKMGENEHLGDDVTLRVKDLKHPYGIIATKGESPNDKANKILKGIKQIKRMGFDSTTLAYKKNAFLTKYYLDRETVKQQSLALGEAEIFGSWVNAEILERRVRNLRVEMVNKVLNQYLEGIQWYYLGDRSKIDEEVLLQPL